MPRRMSQPRRDSPSNVIAFREPANLLKRQSIEIELPAFLVAVITRRAEQANEGAPLEERLSFSEVIEAQLAEIVTIRDVAEFEIEMPGFAEAVQAWLKNACE